MMLSMHYQFMMNQNIAAGDSSNFPQQPPGFPMNPNILQQQQFMMYQQQFQNQQQNFQQNTGQHQQKFPPGFNNYSHQQ